MYFQEDESLENFPISSTVQNELPCAREWHHLEQYRRFTDNKKEGWKAFVTSTRPFLYCKYLFVTAIFCALIKQYARWNIVVVHILYVENIVWGSCVWRRLFWWDIIWFLPFQSQKEKNEISHRKKRWIFILTRRQIC